MAGVNQGGTSNQSKILFRSLTKSNSLQDSSTSGIRTSQIGASSGSEDCIMGGGGRGGGGDRGHDGSDIGSNHSGGCNGVGVGGETGSGEHGSEDCVVDTSEKGAGGGASGNGITHTRGNGKNGYRGGVSGASVAPAVAVDHLTPVIDFAPSLLWLLRPLHIV